MWRAYRARLVREKGEERERGSARRYYPVNLFFCKREYISYRFVGRL